MRRLRGVAGLGIFIAIVGIGLRPTAPGVWLEDDLALSWLFRVRGPVAPPANVVVVSIDKTSADQLGLTQTVWPPPRHIHASVIRRLTLHGVSAIIMDVFFRDRRTVAEDDDLANAISESGRVALFESAERLNYGGGEIIQTRAPIALFRDAALATGVFPLADGTDVRLFWTFFDATSRRVPTLPSVALHIHTLPLLTRMLPLLERAGSNLKDGLHSVATVRDSERLITTLDLEISTHPEVARRALRLLDGGTDLGLSRDERTRLAALVRLYAGDDTRYLNFYGPPGTIRTIPFHELLAERETFPIDLAGAVVFVGEGAVPALTNSDQRDTYRTVYSNQGVDLSGVEIAATAFANLLTESYVAAGATARRHWQSRCVCTDCRVCCAVAGMAVCESGGASVRRLLLRIGRISIHARRLTGAVGRPAGGPASDEPVCRSASRATARSGNRWRGKSRPVCRRNWCVPSACRRTLRITSPRPRRWSRVTWPR